MAIGGPLAALHRWVTPVLEPVVPVRRIDGATRAGVPGSVLVAGDGPLVTRLIDGFLATTTGTCALGRVPTMLATRRLRRSGGNDDLLVACVPSVTAHGQADGRWIHVPVAVDAVQDVAVLDDYHGEAMRPLRRDQQVAQRNRITTRIATDPADLERFHRDHYGPFVRRRYGTSGVVDPLAKLRRSWRRGGLIWMERDGVTVGGTLFSIVGDTLEQGVMGTGLDPEAARKDGVFSAGRVAIIAIAKQRGLKRINYGASQPSRHGGVLVGKLKRAAAIAPRTGLRHTLLVAWPRWRPSIAAWLQHTAPIIETAEGLAVLTAVEPGDVGGDRIRQLGAPGLVRVHVVDAQSPAGLDRDHGAVRHRPGSVETMALG